MPQLIAINEIHRVNKDGKAEVIAPGKPFSANADEVELFVEVHGAAKRAGKATADEVDDDHEDTAKKGKELSAMNKAELIAKAAEVGVEIPEGATNKAIVALIEAKQSEGDLV